MSSFWWGQSAWDELVEKATSELLPAGQVDLALHLEISDQIRSKKVNAKDAMHSLKQRLSHNNPNVIMSTLSLVDTCVKNSGSSFVKEVATREFMEEMTHILKVPTGSNHVKAKVLSLIQVWGIASKGNSSLSYISCTYSLLRAEGYIFPPVTERIDSILLETAVAPEWTDSDCCERCRTPFTLTNRKHHCRQCGATFCQKCSSKSVPLPHLGINDTVRVCDGCYIKVKLAKVADRETVPHLLGTPSSISSSLTPAYTPSIKNKNATTESNNLTTTATATSNSNTLATSGANDDQFEDDLKKAIEMSLKETEQQKKLGYYSGTTTDNTNNSTTTTSKKSAEEEEEEANVAAAIAASLQDMNTNHCYTNTATSPKYNSNELSSIDMENIQLFSTLMQRVQSAGGDVPGDAQINKLYTQIGTLQPKLVKTLDETSQKHETFVTLHTKLNSAVRAYDKLLEERLSHAAQRTRAPSYSNYYGSYSNQIQPQHQYPAPIATNYAYPQTPIALPLSQPVAQTPVQQEQAYPYPQGQPVQTPAVQHQQPISYAVPPTPQVYHQPATQYYPTFSTAAAVATPQQQPSYQTPVTSVQQQQQSTISPTQGPQQYQQQPYFAPNITSASTSYYNQSSHGTFPNNAPQQPQQPNTLYNKPSVEEAPLIEL